MRIIPDNRPIPQASGFSQSKNDVLHLQDRQPKIDSQPLTLLQLKRNTPSFLTCFLRLPFHETRSFHDARRQAATYRKMGLRQTAGFGTIWRKFFYSDCVVHRLQKGRERRSNARGNEKILAENRTESRPCRTARHGDPFGIPAGHEASRFGLGQRSPPARRNRGGGPNRSNLPLGQRSESRAGPSAGKSTRNHRRRGKAIADEEPQRSKPARIGHDAGILLHTVG